jgi:hypothetical protein
MPSTRRPPRLFNAALWIVADTAWFAVRYDLDAAFNLLPHTVGDCLCQARIQLRFDYNLATRIQLSGFFSPFQNLNSLNDTKW